MFKKIIALFLSFVFCAASLTTNAATLTYTGEVTQAGSVVGSLMPSGTIVDGEIIVEDSALAAGLIDTDDIIQIEIRVGNVCFIYQAGDCFPTSLALFIDSIDSAAITGTGGVLGGSIAAAAFDPVFQIIFDLSIDLDAGTFSITTDQLGSVSGAAVLEAPVPIPAGLWLLGSALLGLAVPRRCT